MSQSQPKNIPLPQKCALIHGSSKSVTYKNPQSSAAIVNINPDSVSDYSPFEAYILHGHVDDDLSKDLAVNLLALMIAFLFLKSKLIVSCDGIACGAVLC